MMSAKELSDKAIYSKNSNLRDIVDELSRTIMTRTEISKMVAASEGGKI
jgi:hypothetical protein